MTTEPALGPLVNPQGYLRGLRLYVSGRKTLETGALVDACAVAAVLQAAWPQRRAVTAAEIEVWRALSALPT